MDCVIHDSVELCLKAVFTFEYSILNHPIYIKYIFGEYASRPFGRISVDGGSSIHLVSTRELVCWI